MHEEDQACHARFGRTKRAESLYGPPGHAYVFLIYGMYDCFNVVCEPKDSPAAVLDARARAAMPPLEGGTDGPGKLCRALGINRAHNGARSRRRRRRCGSSAATRQAASRIVATPRIGVDYAGEWAKKPLALRRRRLAVAVEEAQVKSRGKPLGDHLGAVLVDGERARLAQLLAREGAAGEHRHRRARRPPSPPACPSGVADDDRLLGLTVARACTPRRRCRARAWSAPRRPTTRCRPGSLRHAERRRAAARSPPAWPTSPSTARARRRAASRGARARPAARSRTLPASGTPRGAARRRARRPAAPSRTSGRNWSDPLPICRWMAGARHHQADGVEGARPGVDVQVVGVDERAVDVEQDDHRQGR